MNIVCPENLTRIAERFDEVQIRNASELRLMICLIYRKVLEEPHFCETYADLVQILRPRYPEFRPEGDGGRPASFRNVLIDATQLEFEEMLEVAQAGVDPAQCDVQRKRALSNMKFVGHLFLRRLLAERVIQDILSELLRGTSESMVECACQLLHVAGYTLESTPSGNQGVRHFVSRLKDLSSGTIGGASPSKRLQCKIQDLLDMQRRGWQERLLREQARTIEEVRREAEAESQRARGHGAPQTFQMRTITARLPCGTTGPAPAPAPAPAVSPTQTLGKARPADASAAAAGGGAAAAAPDADLCRPQRALVDQGQIRRLFSYFDEEGDADRLAHDWGRVCPPPGAAGDDADSLEQERVAVRCLLEIGVGSAASLTQGKCAEAAAALVSGEALTWRALGAELEVLLGRLADLLLDAPHAGRFLAMLLARLLLCGGGREPALLEAIGRRAASLVPESGDEEAMWELLTGMLRHLGSWGGQEVAREAASRKEISAALRRAGRCSRRELAEVLKARGLVIRQ